MNVFLIYEHHLECDFFIDIFILDKGLMAETLDKEKVYRTFII